MRDTLTAAVDWLLERQHPDGWWVGELETNVTMTAEHVLLLRFLGCDVEPIRRGAIRHILAAQRSDGSWALYYEGPADLSTTIEAYTALKVLGCDPGAPPMRDALAVIHRLGGVARARVFTKIWLALFGQYPWAGVPMVPPEIVYLPPWVPGNLYDFACWARGTVAPLTLVLAHKPVRDLGVTLSELVVEGTEAALSRVTAAGLWRWLDAGLRSYERLPWKPGRSRARAQLVRWITERQEADGSWGGIQPPWVYSLIALTLEGAGLEHPVVRKGLAGLDRFVIEDEAGWRLQACMSPVWDTAWALRALAEAGCGRDHEAVSRSVRWLLREQITAPGDWCVRVRDVPCGGWAFEFDNDRYPDIDDTAVVALALVEAGGPEVREAVERARRWIVAMRSRNGAWAAFDRDNTRWMLYRLPFCDFGAVIDPPSEDVTAHVLEMLAALGTGQADPHVAGGLAYLSRTQTERGSWFGRWGVNHIYGTWCVIEALAALRTARPMVDRAAAWLLSVQNQDGGWGETCYSYHEETFAGAGRSTASQTAWAALTLQKAGLGRHPACGRGVDWLRDHEAGGTWAEPEYTGTGFPRDFYINYHLYRHLFPVMALARDRALHAEAAAGGRPETRDRGSLAIGRR